MVSTYDLMVGSVPVQFRAHGTGFWGGAAPAGEHEAPPALAHPDDSHASVRASQRRTEGTA